jgi:hypothetical protein
MTDKNKLSHWFWMAVLVFLAVTAMCATLNSFGWD